MSEIYNKHYTVNENPFGDTEEINVVFLGGSITEGAGSSHVSKCYANRTGEWLKEYFHDKKVNYYNKGVGGTPSSYGLLRFTRDVASFNPHLVFIEFAVNDDGNDTTMYMESLVKSLQALPTKPYVVFLYTTNETYTTVTAIHERVAEFYDIPQISLKEALKHELNGKNAKDAGYLADSVHPSDLGYDVYFKEIVNCLKTGKYFNRPKVQETQLCETSGAVETAFVSLHGDAVQRSENWILGGGGERPWARTNKLDETVRFSFDGTILAVEQGLLMESDMYDIYVDGEKQGTGDPFWYDRELTDAPQLTMGFATYTLPEGTHEVEIKTVPTTNNESKGGNVFLYHVIVGKPVK